MLNKYNVIHHTGLSDYNHFNNLKKLLPKSQSNHYSVHGLISPDDVLKFYDTIFKTLQDYLSRRFNLPIGSITLEAIEGKLDAVQSDTKIIAELEEVFSKCEMESRARRLAGPSNLTMAAC